MIALIDETSPADRGGIYYVVSAAVLVDETTTTAGSSGRVAAGRSIWVNEGSAVLGRMRLISESISAARVGAGAAAEN